MTPHPALRATFPARGRQYAARGRGREEVRPGNGWFDSNSGTMRMVPRSESKRATNVISVSLTARKDGKCPAWVGSRRGRYMPPWCSGSTSAFQADRAGSSPVGGSMRMVLRAHGGHKGPCLCAVRKRQGRILYEADPGQDSVKRKRFRLTTPAEGLRCTVISFGGCSTVKARGEDADI